MSHAPVFISEIVKYFESPSYKVIVDCTFGAGGYSEMLLNLNEGCKVIALDRDINNLPYAEKLRSKFGDRFVFINQVFSNIGSVLQNLGIDTVDGFVYDLGVSSMQVDLGERGFSFTKDGPLSMEMGLNNITAYDVVNDYPYTDLANIIYKYGEENQARGIARAIVAAREKESIKSTLRLAKIVASAVKGKWGKIHPATKTFQAIRMEVNRELQELESSLKQAISLLTSGGRIGAVTFHSLEDAIVKNIFKDNAVGKKMIGFDRNMGRDAFEFDMVNERIEQDNGFLKIITKKPLVPSGNEVLANIRSRSAKLRIAERI